MFKNSDHLIRFKWACMNMGMHIHMHMHMFADVSRTYMCLSDVK